MSTYRRLTVGAFQFVGSGDPASNVAALARGIKQAAACKVRLLATQECALCGYPPIEVPSSSAIARKAQYLAARRVSELAKQYNMYIVLGMATFRDAAALNTVRLIDPEGKRHKPYHKRALYGWDAENFTSNGSSSGVYIVDGIRVGVRICYEVRFPEYFRELFCKRVELAVVSFADVGKPKEKFDVIQSHLVSRAAENVMYVLSANSISRQQLAPTCLIDPDGRILKSAPLNEESLITGTIVITPPDFGRKGRIDHSRILNEMQFRCGLT